METKQLESGPLGAEMARLKMEYHGAESRMSAYRLTDGNYSIRLYLPAGEACPGEVIRTYRGPDITAARAAYRATKHKWLAAGYTVVQEIRASETGAALA